MRDYAGSGDYDAWTEYSDEGESDFGIPTHIPFRGRKPTPYAHNTHLLLDHNFSSMQQDENVNPWLPVFNHRSIVGQQHAHAVHEPNPHEVLRELELDFGISAGSTSLHDQQRIHNTKPYPY